MHQELTTAGSLVLCCCLLLCRSTCIHMPSWCCVARNRTRRAAAGSVSLSPHFPQCDAHKCLRQHGAGGCRVGADTRERSISIASTAGEAATKLCWAQPFDQFVGLFSNFGSVGLARLVIHLKPFPVPHSCHRADAERIEELLKFLSCSLAVQSTSMLIRDIICTGFSLLCIAGIAAIP